MTGVPRVLPEPALDAKEAKKNAASKGSASDQLSVMAPISMNASGKIVVDFQSKMASLGIQIGSSVQMGSGRDIQEGIVQDITHDHVVVLLKPTRPEDEATTQNLTANQVKTKQLQPVAKPTAAKEKKRERKPLRSHECRNLG